MSGVAREPGGITGPGAELFQDQIRETGEAKAIAAAALRHSTELTLEQIERRVCRPPAPQGHPWRAPTGGPRLAQRFLRASTSYLRMDLGAVVAVIDGIYLGPVISGDPTVTQSDRHFVYGEGPAIDAATSGRFIEVRDFREETWRWPAFAPAALEAGLRSAWCVPLPHAHKPGLVLIFVGREPLTGAALQSERLRRVTRIADALLVNHPGTITAQTICRRIEQVVRDRAGIYQASGVLAHRSSIEVGPALDLMRIKAWAEGRTLAEVSAELIGGAR